MSFLFFQLAPGDFLAEARLNPQISPATIDSLQQRLGTDRPLLSKFASWITGLLEGDLGYSFAYNASVASILIPRALNTLVLAVAAAASGWCAGLFCGLLAARAGPSGTAVFDAFVSILLSCPEVLLALLALMFAMRTGWFPAGGMRSASLQPAGPWIGIRDLVHHLWLPAAVLAAAYFPVVAAHVRSAVCEALAAPFIDHLCGLGVPERRLLVRHALRAALNPLINLMGFSFGSLLGASLIVEVVFAWPGIGSMLIDAILARDLFVVIAALMCSSVLLIGGNLAADILLYRIDPRIRRD